MKVLIAIIAFVSGILLTLVTGAGVGGGASRHYAKHEYVDIEPKPVVPMTRPTYD
jgi:hypothetical protein